MFQATEEFLSFRLLCTETSRDLLSVVKPTTWNRIALQASHQYPFLRHAIVAIGSLSKNTRDALNHNGIPPSTGPELWNSPPACLRGDNDFALQQYNKFLRSSRQALVSGPEGQRLALIVCLLIICIETLQWQHLQVLSHIYSGVQLLESFIASQKAVAQAGFTSYLIEDEIIEQFRMLEVEANMLFDPFPVSRHHTLSPEGDLELSMPQTFSTIEEARHYLDILTRRIRHFIASSRPPKPFTSDFSRERKTSCIDPELLSLAPRLRSTFNNPSPSPSPSTLFPDPTISISLSQYKSLLTTWQHSFGPLFPHTTDRSHPNYLPTLHLAILSSALTITLHTSFPSLSPSTHNTTTPNLLPTYHHILTLSQTILSPPSCPNFLSPSNNPSITSASTGLIGPLRLIATHCSHLPLHKQAISLLQRRPWREGVWWSCSAGELMGWLSSIEEGSPPSASSSTLESSKEEEEKGGGEREETIQESARVRLLEVGIWEEGNVTTGKAMCVRGSGEEAEIKIGEWIWRVGGGEGGVVPVPVPSPAEMGEGLGCEEIGLRRGMGDRDLGAFLSIDGFA